MPRATSPAKSDGQRAASVLRALDDLQAAAGDDLTIIKISEPISSAIISEAANANNNNNNKNSDTAALRTSDVSTASLDATTPSSLEADLAHYRELFAKLRFSYVEQVTKEKFIRAIVGDPPLIVSPQDNADLEAANAAAKARLKARKSDVARLVADLESRARDLARRYGRVRDERRALAELPRKLEVAEERVRALREAAAAAATTTQTEQQQQQQMNLPLGKTLELVEARRKELAALERRLEVLAAQAPRKRKEMERLRTEVGGLESKRANSTAAAREAKRRRENAQGGVEDELEARGRWYRASEMVLSQVLGLEG